MRKKKEKKNNGAIWMGIFVVVILVASTLAFVLSDLNSQGTSLKYNGFDFKRDAQTNEYLLKSDGQILRFTAHPTEVENINMSSQAKGLLLQSQAVVISFDPGLDQNLLTFQDAFRFEFAQVIPKPVVGGVISPSEKYAFPIVTCENATAQQVVVLLNDSTDSSIQTEGSCIIVNGRGYELLRLKDRLIYGLLGVING